MPPPDEPAALAYIEKTLADAYRKEIDQEENVWRSLPFFAATLALQLAALFQVIDRIADPTTIIGWVSVSLLAMAGTLTLLSLGFLAASIYPQRFDYVAKQAALLNYAHELIRAEQTPDNLAQDDPFSALVTLKTEIARQYAHATDHNQRINKKRERRRSIAGLAALGSVLLTVFLVVATYVHYLSIRTEREPNHVTPGSVTSSASHQGSGDDARRQADPSQGTPAPADAGGHQGVVDTAR